MVWKWQVEKYETWNLMKVETEMMGLRERRMLNGHQLTFKIGYWTLAFLPFPDMVWKWQAEKYETWNLMKVETKMLGFRERRLVNGEPLASTPISYNKTENIALLPFLPSWLLPSSQSQTENEKVSMKLGSNSIKGVRAWLF